MPIGLCSINSIHKEKGSLWIKLNPFINPRSIFRVLESLFIYLYSTSFNVGYTIHLIGIPNEFQAHVNFSDNVKKIKRKRKRESDIKEKPAKIY